MTTRMIISLKKVANKPRLNLMVPSEPPINIEDRYSQRWVGDIPLSALRGERR